MGQMNLHGQTHVVKNASGVAASGTVAMVAAKAGTKFRVLAMTLQATSTTVTNVYVINGDNSLYGNSGNPIPMGTDKDGDQLPTVQLNWNPGGHFDTDTANEALNVVLSAAQDIIYTVTYAEL